MRRYSWVLSVVSTYEGMSQSDRGVSLITQTDPSLITQTDPRLGFRLTQTGVQTDLQTGVQTDLQTRYSICVLKTLQTGFCSDQSERSA